MGKTIRQKKTRQGVTTIKTPKEVKTEKATSKRNRNKKK